MRFLIDSSTWRVLYHEITNLPGSCHDPAATKSNEDVANDKCTSINLRPYYWYQNTRLSFAEVLG